ETENWACCTALLARVKGEGEAFFLLAQPREAASTLFVMGEPAPLEEIFQHPLAAVGFVWISAKDEHMKCLRKHWHVKDPEKMLRMAVSRETFRPPKKKNRAVDLRRLEPGDNTALEEAYETAFGSPVTARLMAKGPYYGVWSKGRLVSVAGTHVICPRFGLAAAGNVWTRPGYRGRGLGTLTVGAVTQELLESCGEVVLNVREDNLQATRLYERLGYRIHCHYWQMRGGAPRQSRRSRLAERRG
nr:GNAT family N-acetyltransferase [Armatimonadota bacterium]NIO76056.1 GNAT family N-acetyltransferase [Armatimonadota bacterium]NIO97003.1 GNAT family N-acetyltransferase [Armatimonadota bacterium]